MLDKQMELAMKIAEATKKQIIEILNKMREVNKGGEVFDEAFVVYFSGEELLPPVVICSPRSDEEIYNAFAKDFKQIREELLGGDYASPGDIHLDSDAPDTTHDGFICVGEGFFIILNYLGGSIDDIKMDGNWLAIQRHIVELSKVRITFSG